MNFSECTLVSFGDSFTFGQDAVYRDVPFGELYDNGKWKSECNEKSYTQVICDRMGFKDNLNFGIPGSSSERSLMLLEEFLRQNPTLKVFVLFNFTSPLRCLNMAKQKHSTPKYDIVEMSPQNRQCVEEQRYEGIDKKSVEHYYTYFRNDVQEMYQHIKDKRMLYYLLSAHNVPHATFDILNDVDHRMIRDNPLQYLSEVPVDIMGLEYMYSNDENYVFAEMNYFNSYYKELIDNTPLLSHIGIDYLKGCPNGTQFIGRLGDEMHGFHNNGHYFTSEYGGHWVPEGHIEFAKLVEKYINENYN